MTVTVPAQVAVFIKLADANGYVSATAGWQQEERLIPVRSIMRPGGMGEASFKLLRKTRNEGQGWQTDEGATLGSLVCIAPMDSNFSNADPTSSENEQAVWWGTITRRDFSIFAENDDEVGSVSALGLGFLLDRGRITGFRQEAAPGTANPELGEVLLVPPVANISIGDELYVGNKTLVSFGGVSRPLFTRDSALLTVSGSANYWTRREVIDHVLRWCMPAGLPRMQLYSTGSPNNGSEAITGGAAAVLSIVEKVSFDLRGLTLKGALDLLIPRSRGVTWSLWPRENHWAVWIDSCAATAVGDLTANPLRNIELVDIPYVDARLGEEVTYDAVTIEGSPDSIVHCFTVAVPDGNLTQGWDVAGSTVNADAYKAGASAASGYSTWALARQKKANAEIRQSLYASVYARFILKPGADGNLYRQPTPGDTGTPSAAALVLAVPDLSWDSATSVLSISATVDATPYLPEATLERVIPWPLGVGVGGPGSADDKRTPEQKARPAYMTLRVFAYESSRDDGFKWRDFNTVGDGYSGPSATPDRGATFRLELTPPEMLAKGHWPSTTAVTFMSPLPNDNPYASNWETLRATVAIASGQPLRVTRYRTGYNAATVRNPLVLSSDRLKCWVVHAGTILQLKSDNTPDRIAATTFVRNDYATAQLWCDMASAFALQARRPGYIELAGATARYQWAEVGELIGALIKRREAAPGQTGPEVGRVTVNCTVEEVERVYDAEAGGAPRTIVRFASPELPDFRGGGSGGGISSSPTAGGQVSVANNGTVAQAVAEARGRVAKLEARAQNIPVVYPRQSGGATRLPVLTGVVGSDTLVTIGATAYKGILASGTAPTAVPQADPTSVVSFANGLGKALLDGVYVWVSPRCDPGTGVVTDLITPLPNGQVFLSRQTTTLPITGGGGATVTVYQPFAV